MTNRVWIEIDKTNEIDGKRQPIDHDLNRERAKLYSNLIRKLSPEREDQPDVIRWGGSANVYYKCDPLGSDTPLDDNGSWWNLDYLGRID